MPPALVVIDIRSLSYTGTTWVNLLAGSHPSVFTLGVPTRAFHALRGTLEFDKVCRIHGARCPVWVGRHAEIQAAHNPFVGFTAVTGTTAIALNNPFVEPAALALLDDATVSHRSVSLVRDGRAVVTSYLGHHPDKSFEQAVDWLVANRRIADSPVGVPSIRVRYEDIAANQAGFLIRLGELTGIEYDHGALRFWEHEHHPAGGNPGPFQLIRRHLRGRPGPNDPDVVEQRYQRVIADPTDVHVDERWRRELSDAQLAHFDRVAGAINRDWGYA